MSCGSANWNDLFHSFQKLLLFEIPCSIFDIQNRKPDQTSPLSTISNQVFENMNSRTEEQGTAEYRSKVNSLIIFLKLLRLDIPCSIFDIKKWLLMPKFIASLPGLRFITLAGEFPITSPWHV
jgi:hypothetical protein